MDLFGQIDLTLLGQIVRSHPECVKTIQKKDGTQHQFLNINVCERRQPNQYGHTHYIKANVPKSKQRDNLSYYISDLRPSQIGQPKEEQPSVAAPASPQQSSQQTSSPQPSGDNEELPF